MKLSRRFLILAAAALVTLPAARADVTVNYASPQTNLPQTLVGDVLTGVVNISNLSAPGSLPSPTQIQELTRTITSLNVGNPIGPVSTVLTLNQQVAATTTVKLLSDDFTAAALNGATFAAIPVFVKTGGGTLQYDAFKDINYFGNNTFTNNSNLPNDLRSQGAFSGIVVVNQGVFMSSGYLNQWANYGGFAPAGFTTRMVGAKAVVVQGNATLSFQNSAYNVVSQGPILGDSQLGNPSSPLLFRLNFVHNLYSGTLANFEAGVDGTDVNTILDVGKDADYVLNADFDAGVVGSIGRIDGAGRFYKSGSGALTILNSSRLTGDVFISGGDLALNDPNGLALRQAASVNLIGGSPDGQTTLTEFNSATDAALGTEWRPGYLPGAANPVLEIRTSQTIRNLQALYAELATNLWDAGPGSGTRIDVGANQRLTILQDENLDGYYAGSVNGGQGFLDKQGLGTLALMGTSSTIGEIDINAGKIIANVQSLGYGRVVLGGSGTLSIVQNNAGTLRAQINGALGSILTVAPTDAILNTRSGNLTIGNGQLGVIDVYNRQDLFYGSLIVKNGITLAFSFGVDDTFINASSIVLSSGYDAALSLPGFETTIRFNDTTQRVNNLAGDPNTRIDLGRGTVTLNQTAATTYQGKVTGAGNLVKQGASTMTLAGANSYYGATIVKQGNLALTGVNSIQNSAGLVLLAGTALNATGNQTVGALFGAAGSTINLNGGTLTVGKTTDQIGQLNNALSSFAGSSPDANPAYYLQTTPTVAVDIGLPWAAAGTRSLTLDSVAGLSAGSPVTGIEPTAPITAGAFYIRAIGSGTAATNTIVLPNITNLAVGQTIGSIAIVKPITAGAAGAFTVTVGNATGLAIGQTVTGLGIAAGTRIQAITGNVVTLTAALTTASSGNLTVATGIPAGTTITAINLGTNQLTLSNFLTAQAAGSVTASQPTLDVASTADLAIGQTVFSASSTKAVTRGNLNALTMTLADVNNLVVGQMVTGVGIPAGTTITAINAGTNVITLSTTLTAASSGTLTVLSGVPTGSKITAINGNTITLDTNLIAPAAGTLAIRTGIPTGAVITAINGNTITLDKALTDQSAGSLTNLPVTGMSRDNTVGFLASTLGEQVLKTVVTGTLGANTVTLADVTGLVVGRTVIGTGIPAGATITAINGNIITLSTSLTAAAAGSVRVLTSTDTQVLSFRGTITGTGGLTKVGPERLILAGINTYTGATNIQGGILQLNWDAVPNTSGIVIGALGSLAINVDSGSHAFDRAITGLGGFEKLGAGTLVINTTTGWSTGQIDIVQGVVEFNPGNLSSITGGLVSVRAGTSFQLNTPNDLAWTGSISGQGNTVKTGAGTLTIGGDFTATGTLTVQAGKVIVNALPTDGTEYGLINVAAGTTFADKVAGTTGSQVAVSTIIPVASSAGFYRNQLVSGTGIPNGSFIVAVGTNSITLNNATTAPAAGTITGAETYGAWIIIPGNQITAGTTFTVPTVDGLRLGMRVFDNTVTGIAGLLGTIVALDAATNTVTLSAATTNPLGGNVAFQQGDIVGAGNFEKAGAGTLTLDVPLSITGAVNLTGGTLIVNTEAAFRDASAVTLGAGTTLDVSGFDQDLANVSGAATSLIIGNNTTLTVNTSTGTTTIYRGQITGGADIEKFGAGTLNLARLGSANVLGDLNIHAGTLIGSQAGYGNASLSVDDGATIGFNNDDPTSAWTYTSPVTSTNVGTGTAGGTILKTGAGVVELSNVNNTATNFLVQGGKLIVHDDRANTLGTSTTQGGTNTTEIFTANLAANTSLEVALGAGTERALGAQITAAAGSKLVLSSTGADVSLTSGSPLGSIGLQGNVWLWTNGQSEVVGVDGTADSFLILSFTPGSGAVSQAVTLRQALPTTMLGTVASNIATDLTLVGPARASFVASNFATTFFAGPVNTLTVGTTIAAGHLEILAAFNGESLTLAKSSNTLTSQGSVAVRAEVGTMLAPEVFAGTVLGVAGAGRFIKTGAGVLDGTTASVTAPVFSSYVIEAGRLIVQAQAASILGGRPIELNGGTLAIQQDTAAAEIATGAFSSSNGTGAIDVLGVAGAGLLTIGSGFAGGLNLIGSAAVQLGTSSNANIAVAGNVTVDATSVLRGSAVMGTVAAPVIFANAGKVAPGYSPGVITVNGNVTNTGTYQMELSATALNGTLNDRIEFLGTADLNQGGTGKIELARFGLAALARGQRFVLFKGLTPATVTVATVGGASGSPFLATTTTAGLKAGQVLAGTGLASGTSISAVVAAKSVTPTGGVVGTFDVLTNDTTGLAVGQVIAGTGLQAGSVITAITAGTSITVSKTLTATPAGTLAAAAGVSLSGNLTAAPSGTVAITPSTTSASYFTSVIPAASITMTGLAPKPYLLSIPGNNVKAVTAGSVGTDTITLTNVTGLVIGQAATGTGVPANAVIKAIDNATNTITLNVKLTSAAFGNLTTTLGTIGVPVLPNEIAVYSVRNAAEYEAFQGPTPLINVIKSLAQVDMVHVGNGVDGNPGTTDDVWQATPAGTLNLLGSKLALMTDAQLQSAIHNLTPFGAASVAAISIEGLRTSEDAITKRLEMRRFDRSGLSIVQSEWFFNSDARQLKLGASGEVQTKGNLYGVSAGVIKQTNEGANLGFIIGGNHVTTSGDTSAKFNGNDIRADAFAGTTFFNDLMSLDAGVSVSRLSGSATRASLTSPGATNTSSPTATTIGGWVRLGTVFPMKSVGAYATPFLGAEVSSTKVSGLDETGQADALQVTAKSVSQMAIRAGVGFHKQWESEDGTWRYRLSADLGYLKQGSGETGDFTTTNTDQAALNGTSYTSALRVTGGSGYYFAPSLSFGPNENTTYSLGLTYEKNQGNSTGLNFSYRKRF
jgi:fibronectin-binding autotransporter adhesin